LVFDKVKTMKKNLKKFIFSIVKFALFLAIVVGIIDLMDSLLPL